jgi:hypothetical protein
MESEDILPYPQDPPLYLFWVNWILPKVEFYNISIYVYGSQMVSFSGSDFS